MSVNMFRLRLTIDCQPRTKKGQPHQRTTGVASANSIQGRTCPELRCAQGQEHESQQRDAQRDADPQTPNHAVELRGIFFARAVARLERHAAFGASSRAELVDLGIHGADVLGLPLGLGRRRGVHGWLRGKELLWIGLKLRGAALPAEDVGGASVLNDSGCFGGVDLHPADRVQPGFDHPMASFQPAWISSLFMGAAVRKPRIIAICIMNQYAGLFGCRCGRGNNAEEDQRHPAVHAELEGDDRKGLSALMAAQTALKRRKMAHGLNAEVLKDDAQGPGCEKVKDEAGPQGGAEEGDGESEERELDDHVRKRAACSRSGWRQRQSAARWASYAPAASAARARSAASSSAHPGP